MTQQNEIRCPACGCLFGVEHEGRLNIKHRELFRTIENGPVYGPCRRCGTQVRWPSRYRVEKGR